MPALFMFILICSRTYTHSITLIKYIHPSPLAEVPLIASQLSGKNLRGAEQGLGPALQQATLYHFSYVTPLFKTQRLSE